MIVGNGLISCRILARVLDSYTIRGNRPLSGGYCLRRSVYVSVLAFAAVFLAACPRTNQDYDAGRKAELLEDYDTALVDYQRALRVDPSNAEYKLRTIRMRFEAGQFHVEQGEKAAQKR